jgi:hypothetical protein
LDGRFGFSTTSVIWANYQRLLQLICFYWIFWPANALAGSAIHSENGLPRPSETDGTALLTSGAAPDPRYELQQTVTILQQAIAVREASMAPHTGQGAGEAAACRESRAYTGC